MAYRSKANITLFLSSSHTCWCLTHLCKQSISILGLSLTYGYWNIIIIFYMCNLYCISFRENLMFYVQCYSYARYLSVIFSSSDPIKILIFCFLININKHYRTSDHISQILWKVLSLDLNIFYYYCACDIRKRFNVQEYTSIV